MCFVGADRGWCVPSPTRRHRHVLWRWLAGWLPALVLLDLKLYERFFYTHTPKEAHTRVGAGGESVYVANDSRAGAQLGIRTRIWTRGGRGRGEGECPITVITEPASDPETSR